MDLSFVPVVFFAGAVVLGGWGLRRRQDLDILPKDWRSVTGRVVEVGGSPRVEYTAPDGKRLRIPVPPATTLDVGSDVALLVDPADASRARLAQVDREAVTLVRLLLVLAAISLALAVPSFIAFT